MPNDMGLFPPPVNNDFSQQQGGVNAQNNVTNTGRSRGGMRGTRNRQRKRSDGSIRTINQHAYSYTTLTELQEAIPPAPMSSLAPVPVIAPPAAATPAYAVPERPQSPTLCKFSLKCTNAHCRYSHPSPVATVESGIVLSNDPCEKGRDCKDKDCVKAHVSPAALNPNRKYFLLSWFLVA
jgi:hypothetical protein